MCGTETAEDERQETRRFGREEEDNRRGCDRTNVIERRVALCRKRDKSKECVAACAGSRSAIQINFVHLSTWHFFFS